MKPIPNRFTASMVLLTRSPYGLSETARKHFSKVSISEHELTEMDLSLEQMREIANTRANKIKR